MAFSYSQFIMLQFCFVSIDKGDDLGALHDLDFVMIKYPRKRNSNSLPHERVFTMDYENVVCISKEDLAMYSYKHELATEFEYLHTQVIMWRQTEFSKFNRSNSCKG